MKFFQKEPEDIWGNIKIPDHCKRCPSCGVDRGEMFGLGHQAQCDYGTGRNNAGAKVRRKKNLTRM
jgi:hypothetical protein